MRQHSWPRPSSLAAMGSLSHADYISRSMRYLNQSCFFTAVAATYVVTVRLCPGGSSSTGPAVMLFSSSRCHCVYYGNVLMSIRLWTSIDSCVSMLSSSVIAWRHLSRAIPASMCLHRYSPQRVRILLMSLRLYICTPCLGGCIEAYMVGDLSPHSLGFSRN